MRVLGGLALLPVLGGCVELTSGLMMLSDSMEMDNGGYWNDEHYQDQIGTDYCPGLMEYGRVNNQTYVRVRNYADTTMYATVHWNTGLESAFVLSPGETSHFVYMSPSITPASSSSRCD